MPKNVPAPRPTDAELAILRVLWERGPSTVRQVHEVLTVRVSIPGAVIGDAEQVVRTHEQIARNIAAIGGVSGVGLSNSLERLRLAFGSGARLELVQSGPDEVACEVLIPSPSRRRAHDLEPEKETVAR